MPDQPLAGSDTLTGPNGSTFELRAFEPQFVAGVISVPWEYERTSGDALPVYDVELRVNGRVVDTDQSRRPGLLPVLPSKSGTLTGTADPGASVEVRWVANESTMSVSTTVPEDAAPSLVTSPIDVPEWLSPPSEPASITMPQIGWSEAVIEGVSVSDEGGTPPTVAYSIDVAHRAFYGSGEPITRTISIGTDPDGGGDSVEVSLSPGETATVEGEYELASGSAGEQTVRVSASVENPAWGRDLSMVRPRYTDVSFPNPYGAEPLSRPSIPEPHPAPDLLLENPRALLEDTLLATGEVFEQSSGNITVAGRTFASASGVSDQNLADAIRAWQEGNLSDTDLSKIHGLWDAGTDLSGVPGLDTHTHNIILTQYDSTPDGVALLYTHDTGRRGVEVTGPGAGTGLEGTNTRLVLRGLVPGATYTVDGDQSNVPPFDGISGAGETQVNVPADSGVTVTGIDLPAEASPGATETATVTVENSPIFGGGEDVPVTITLRAGRITRERVGSAQVVSPAGGQTAFDVSFTVPPQAGDQQICASVDERN